MPFHRSVGSWMLRSRCCRRLVLAGFKPLGQIEGGGFPRWDAGGVRLRAKYKPERVLVFVPQSTHPSDRI